MIYFIHNILTNIFRPVFLPSSVWCFLLQEYNYVLQYRAFHNILRDYKHL